MKIGVVGLGLIGGSIFRALSGRYNTIGISASVNAPNVTSDIHALKDCDLVFVCTPMSATLDMLETLDSILSENAIVTDVCSVKGFVCNKTYSYKFVPSHPMAGTEHSGWNNSFPELFNGKKWVLTPLNNNFKDEQKILESVIESMGADIIITTPEEHDEAVAFISHLPLIVAQTLCENIKDNALAQAIVSSGFRDATRLALSNTLMATDMLNLNKSNILKSISVLKTNIDTLIKENYSVSAENIKVFRKNLY